MLFAVLRLRGVCFGLAWLAASAVSARLMRAACSSMDFWSRLFSLRISGRAPAWQGVVGHALALAACHAARASATRCWLLCTTDLAVDGVVDLFQEQLEVAIRQGVMLLSGFLEARATSRYCCRIPSFCCASSLTRIARPRRLVASSVSLVANSISVSSAEGVAMITLIIFLRMRAQSVE
jgi:hypothetical protein